MTDREKVIKGLECCCSATLYDCEQRCPYGYLFKSNRDCMSSLLLDTFALLKKQEPQPVRLERFPVNEPLSHCPVCGIELSSFIHQPSGLRPKYCPICGQAVKWE